MIELLMFACFIVAFTLSGLEMALLTVNRVRVRHAAEEGDAVAARLTKYLEHRASLLQMASSLHHFVSLVAYGALVILVTRWVGHWGWAVALFLALPLYLLLMELLPKLLFEQYPFRLLRRFIPLARLIHGVARPWTRLSRKFLAVVPADSTAHDSNGGLAHLTQTIVDLKLLSPTAHEMLNRLPAFQKLKAADLMVPLTSLTALPATMPLTNALVLTRELKRPWQAVLADHGALLGWLDTVSLPPKPPSDRLVRQFMRPLGQVRTTESALRCLQMLRKRGEPVAAVLNDKAVVVGVVTEEALAKALFGGSVAGV